MLFVAREGDTELGYCHAQVLLTGKATGVIDGPLLELVYLEIVRPSVAALRGLFCSVLSLAVALSAEVGVRGLIMEPANPHVERLLRHMPSMVRLAEHPYYYLLREGEFADLSSRYCRKTGAF